MPTPSPTPRATLNVLAGAIVIALLAAGCAGSGQTTRPSASIEGSWEPRADAPEPLTEVAVAAHADRIWVAGGFGGDGSGSVAVQVYDPATDDWSEGPDLPEAVHHAALVSDGTALRLIGGFAGDGLDTPTDAVWVLAVDGERWLPAEPLPEPRAAGAAAWDGKRIVYAGGVEPGSISAAVFVFEDGAWRQIARLADPREHLAAASGGDGATYIVGGRAGGLDTNVATAELLRDATVRSIRDLPTPRGGVAAFWWPVLGACLVGGESPGGTNAQVECIDADGDIAILPDLGRPRHGLGAVVVDGSAYALLGGDRPGLFVSAAVEVLRLP